MSEFKFDPALPSTAEIGEHTELCPDPFLRNLVCDMFAIAINTAKMSANISTREESEGMVEDTDDFVEITYTRDEVRFDTSCRIALNLLREGFEVATIAEVTELDESDVRILADEYGIAVSA